MEKTEKKKAKIERAKIKQQAAGDETTADAVENGDVAAKVDTGP